MRKIQTKCSKFAVNYKLTRANVCPKSSVAHKTNIIK